MDRKSTKNLHTNDAPPECPRLEQYGIIPSLHFDI